MKRIVEIDIAKGICILLMVIGHSGMTGYAHNFIYSFHMPFFFFISGVTTNINRSFSVFLKNKVKGLVIPFLIYYLIHLPAYALVYERSVWKQFLLECYSRIDGALWFVPILFLAQIVNWLVPQKQNLEFVAFVTLAAFSSAMCADGISLPWNLDVLGLASAEYKSIFSENVNGILP